VISEAELQTARLCVVGGINRDLKTAPFPPGAHLLQDGETTVQSITETVGGGGANSACIAAGLGAPVAFVGRLGADDLGARLGATLTANGVVCYLHQDTASPTGTTLNLVYESGSRHFISRHPNNEALSFDDLDLEPVAAADHLLRADVWFSEPMLYGGNDELFRRAGEAGVAVSLDLNWDPRWGADPAAEIDRRKRAVRDLLPLVDLVHGNIAELNEFTGAAALSETLTRLTAWGAGAVVVHMGAEGAGYFANGAFVVEPPVPTEKILAVTGTGDVLSACMMLMHRRDQAPPQEKLRLANRIVAEFMEGRRRFIPKLE